MSKRPRRISKAGSASPTSADQAGASAFSDRGGGKDGSNLGFPVFNENMNFRAVGSTGLRQFSGWVREEFLPQLSGLQAARTYREMLDNDPSVGAVIFSIQSVMRKTEWRVTPADLDLVDGLPRAKKPPAATKKANSNSKRSVEFYADFVDSCREDMSHTWEDFVIETMSMLGYGYAPMETVYKRRMGRQEEGSDTATSNYDDGLIGWRKIAIRGQDTVLKWFFTDDGSLMGLTQQPWYGGIIDIPIQKLLLFRPIQHKGNPEGRALDPATPIPTPDGWRAMDDLQVGSKVFDETGAIRYVVARADWNERPAFRVLFSDGHEIIADANHQWLVQNQNERNARRPGKLRTTAEIAAKVKSKSTGASNYSIPWGGALDYPEQAHVIDPYFLGLWLGDGTSLTSGISCHADDLEETCVLIEACGYTARAARNGRPDGNGRLINVTGEALWDRQGPQAPLTALGLRGNKHIPQAYLRGSVAQRMALLSGLMDSDGHVDNWGRCEFTNTNSGLSFGVAELVRSLGIGAHLTTKTNSHGNMVWLVKFTPTWVPFRLARKAAKCRTERQRMHHYIVAVEPVAPRRTVCIEVDSPSHLFLAGDGMVPTHNSILRNSYRPWFMKKRLEEAEAIMIERMGGLPVVRIPNEILQRAAQGDADAVVALAAYQKMARGVRVDEQMGIVMPSDTWPGVNGPSSQFMYGFELMTPTGGGRGTNNPSVPIERYKSDILTSTLADFLLLGHNVRGAQNLGETKVDMFMGAVEGYQSSMAAVLNRHALPRLWGLNDFDSDMMPKIEPDLAQRADLDVLSNTVLRLSQAGMPLFPDEDLEEWIRDAVGLPDMTDASREARALLPKPGEDPGAANAPKQPGAENTAAQEKQDRLKKSIRRSLAQRVKYFGGNGR